jgi:hypothetical protein
MKIKTNIKVGAIMIEEMTVRLTVRDGATVSPAVVDAVKGALNHNQTVARSLNVKTNVKAGLIIVVC